MLPEALCGMLVLVTCRNSFLSTSPRNRKGWCAWEQTSDFVVHAPCGWLFAHSVPASGSHGGTICLTRRATPFTHEGVNLRREHEKPFTFRT